MSMHELGEPVCSIELECAQLYWRNDLQRQPLVGGESRQIADGDAAVSAFVYEDSAVWTQSGKDVREHRIRCQWTVNDDVAFGFERLEQKIAHEPEIEACECGALGIVQAGCICCAALCVRKRATKCEAGEGHGADVNYFHHRL